MLKSELGENLGIADTSNSDPEAMGSSGEVTVPTKFLPRLKNLMVHFCLKG